jgi:hypothetical protein
MQPTEVPIFYGTPLKLDNPEAYFEPNQPRADTRSKLFPHSERSCWGGCTLGDERTARIYICSECESAEKQWRLAKVQSQ